MPRTIALASDHAGFELKMHIRAYLEKKGYICVDVGTDSTQRVDAVDYAVPACQEVLSGRCECALLFCGTGVAMSIAANKMPGMRACCCSDAFTAELTRRHNNANALCMGGRVVGVGLAEKLVDLFLAAEFEEGVYQMRNDKITALEQKYAGK